MIIGMLAANVLRSAGFCFALQAGLGGVEVTGSVVDLAAFLLVGGAVTAVLWGTCAGLVVGLVHAMAWRCRHPLTNRAGLRAGSPA